MNHEGAVSGKLLIYWLVTIILPCLVLLLPVNEIMTADLKVFLSMECRRRWPISPGA